MTNLSNSTQPLVVTESAFGRPASWWAALPAVLVGLTAFVLAVYGTWFMPARLPGQYAAELEEAQAVYRKLSQSNSSSASWRRIDAAGELDVIYSRLVALERNSPERYWEWAEFLELHAESLEHELHDPAASFRPDMRERFEAQAQKFDSKSQELFEQLATLPSGYHGKAILRVSQTRFMQGIGQFGVSDATQLIANLREVVDQANVKGGAFKGATEWLLTATELDTARLLLVELLIEEAWQAHPPKTLIADREKLRSAWELMERFEETQHVGNTVQWQAVRRQLYAFLAGAPGIKMSEGDETPPSAATPVAQTSLGKNSRNDAWCRELAKLQLAAVDSHWQEVVFLLSQSLDQGQSTLANPLARTICRLASTSAVDSPGQWFQQADVGLLLVAKIAPQLPEFSELLWACARRQANPLDSELEISPELMEAITRGQNTLLKHSISAISEALAGQPRVAETHLELIRRSHGSLSWIARVGLWRAQTLSLDASILTQAADENAASIVELNRLIELLNMLTQLEPESGINWFALGTLQFRAQQYDGMRAAFAKARDLLGEVPAIDQMLDAAPALP